MNALSTCHWDQNIISNNQEQEISELLKVVAQQCQSAFDFMMNVTLSGFMGFMGVLAHQTRSIRHPDSHDAKKL